jgi:hypothetical protein
VATLTTFIIETTHKHYAVEDSAGPLAEHDSEVDDPADGAELIWQRIDRRGPIWTDAGVRYFNPAHVILVREHKREA